LSNLKVLLSDQFSVNDDTKIVDDFNEPIAMEDVDGYIDGPLPSFYGCL